MGLEVGTVQGGGVKWLSPAHPPSLPPDLARSEVFQALDGQFVHGVNLIVVGRVGEREGQQALLLQVGF